MEAPIVRILDSNRRNLEDAFFLKQDKILLEELKALESLKESKKNLADISGIKDEVILEKLVKLNVRPETLASLAVIPLVEVAWADGKVEDKERQAVLKAAQCAGFAKDGIDYVLLESWLSHKPEATLLKSWTHYIEGLCKQLTEPEKDSLKAELIGHAKQVADASGGILGLATISKAEQNMITKLEKAFD